MWLKQYILMVRAIKIMLIRKKCIFFPDIVSVLTSSFNAAVEMFFDTLRNLN